MGIVCGMRRGHLLIACGLLVVAACSGGGTADTTTTAAVDGTAVTSTLADTTTTVSPATTTTTIVEATGPAVVVECEPGTGPDFSGQVQSSPDYADESLRCASFDGATLAQPSFAGADLSGATFVGATLSQGTFQDASLVGADFTGADLAQVRFNNSDLTGALLGEANAAGGRFEGATCPDGEPAADGTCNGQLTPVPVEFVASSVALVLAPIEFVPLCEPDSGTDFTGQDLVQPDFRREDLRCADFTGADLAQPDFADLDVSGAVFDGATVAQGEFVGTRLFGASFDGTTVTQTKFENANLIGADITTAEFVGDRWSNTICPNGVNSDQAGGTCLGSRTALDLPEVDFDEITASGITVRQGDGVTTYTVEADVLFDFDSADLGVQALGAIDQIVGSITERFGTIVEIQIWGHADAIGDVRYNLNLSQQRADNVAALMETEFGDVPIVAIGLGEAQPVAPNTNRDGSDNPEGRAQNRRVEVVVRTG